MSTDDASHVVSLDDFKAAWATAFSGNVDFVHQLGALELAKADLLHRANAPKT